MSQDQDTLKDCCVCGEALTEEDKDSDAECASIMCETCRIDMGRDVLIEKELSFKTFESLKTKLAKILKQKDVKNFGYMVGKAY